MANKKNSDGVALPWFSYVDASLSASLLVLLLFMIFTLLYAEAESKKSLNLKNFLIHKPSEDLTEEIKAHEQRAIRIAPTAKQNEYLIQDIYGVLDDQLSLEALNKAGLEAGKYNIETHYNPSNIPAYHQRDFFNKMLRIKALIESEFPKSTFKMTYLPGKEHAHQVKILLDKLDE